MVIVENTQNACGGKALDADYMRSVGLQAKELGLHFHVDGARIFNAAVALRVPAAALLESADSITFCLSKGLCAPIGSVLCGDTQFIRRARRIRKILGGGMRQAGIIAAAGIIALDSMIERLEEDHLRACRLAEGLDNIRGIQLTKGSPNTNMVFFRLDPVLGIDNMRLIVEMKTRGVLINDTSEGEIRLVTHHDVDDLAIDRCLEALREIVS